MRILIHGINFSPEVTGVGRYTGDMARWLVERGHRVRVVAAPPYYPDWKVAKGYRGWRYTREDRDGMRVWRAPLWVPRRPHGVNRIVHLVSFALSALPLLLWEALAFRPDVVWVAAPAFTCTPGAWLAAKLCGAATWLHVQDFEFDAACNLGLLKGHGRRLANLVERTVMGAFDRVSTVSSAMMSRLGHKGVDGSRIRSFLNWVDVDRIRPGTTAATYRKALGIEDDAIVALYSGSMGAKQGLEVVAEAAALLAPRRRIHLILCGEGQARARLHAACRAMDNVHLLPLQPTERLPELLASADLHLLPQRRSAADLVMPSRLGAMLASGRPVVATADPGTEVFRIVSGKGIVVPPGDAAALADAIVALSEAPERRWDAGVAARQYAEAHLARDSVLSRFELDMARLLKARRTTPVAVAARSKAALPVEALRSGD